METLGATTKTAKSSRAETAAADAVLESEAPRLVASKEPAARPEMP